MSNEDKDMSLTESLIRLIVGIVIVLWSVGLCLSSWNGMDFDKELAKEYGVPMGEFNHERYRLSMFPLPHEEYYVNTEMGEEYILATNYFGIVSFKDENVKKICHPEAYKVYNEYLKNSNSNSIFY